MEPGDLFLPAVLLSIERFAYAWIYRRPTAYAALCERVGLGDPVDALQRLFVVFKGIQLVVFSAWCLRFGAETGWPSNWDSPIGGGALGLIVVGQILNLAVFLRLGRVGVFYGNRFGRPVEWSREFPYSVLDHPQYVGTVLSIWGLFLLLRHPHPDWFVLPLLETAYYVLGAFAERMPQSEATRAES